MQKEFVLGICIISSREREDVVKMGVTIKQIAEMAGVHRSTVDKVLHNREGVSDPVRKRVQKIIDECNYEANPIGKALKMQDKELHIKVILLEVDALPYLKAGIEEELRKYGSFHIIPEYITIAYSDISGQAETLKSCVKEKTDGIILSPINAPEIVNAIDFCEHAKIPVITVNTDIKGSQRLCFIGQDGFKAGRVAGRLMGEFLQGQGKVAVFTSDGDDYQSFPFGTREGGFREFVKETYPKMQIMESISTQEKPQVIRREMRKLCEQEKDLSGIFITCGGVKAVGDVLQEYERENLKLICYENYPEILELMKEDTVTSTLDSGIKEQGKRALEVLMDKLIYDRKPPHKHLYSEIRIMLKESI